jgi:hypothetical protein
MARNYADSNHNGRIMFLKSATAALLLALLSSSAFSAESLSNREDIHGRSYASIVANLKDSHGLTAELVEAYGDKILVHARDESGTVSILFVDKTTLQPIADTRNVGTRLNVTRETSPSVKSGRPDQPARSLVEDDDDNSDTATGF